MNTPIRDFINEYIESAPLRLHMPGHKGKNYSGFEKFDITEVDGADDLYGANGVIAQSEKNASKLFGARTFYSTEGSSLAIKAMLFLAIKHAKETGLAPIIAAGRNAHKSFINAAALIGFDVSWIYSPTDENYLTCKITAKSLSEFLDGQKTAPCAVYLTSPDYLGNVTDVKEIAKVCKARNVLLLVDNAHGAYLKFLQPSLHPIDLGADMCCDSAHKTLPCLTGGAYLHLSKNLPQRIVAQVKDAMALFGSTSPSYLILQSLDILNAYLADGYKEKLINYAKKVDALKRELCAVGYVLSGNEPLKITVSTKPYGYTGKEFNQILKNKGIVCEFYDRDYTVLMLTPDINLDRLKDALLSIPKKEKIETFPPKLNRPIKVTDIRQATLSTCEKISVKEAKGKILASASVSCPPAVPILVCGEKIDDDAIRCFEYYGIIEIFTVK